VVSVGESLQHSVDLLRFLGKLNLHQQLAHSHVDGITEERKLAHIAAQHRQKEGIVGLAQIARNDALIDVVRLNSLQIMARCFSFLPSR
jgi:hypothetical protein